MVNIRQQNDIALSLIEFFKSAQPNLDTKAGSVSRDLLVDGFAVQLATLYQELSRISSLQSLRLALGSDLDRLASNYGAIRKAGTKASGPALFTFSEITSDVAINRGDVVSARNGATFVVQSDLIISPVLANNYKSIASQFRAQLDQAGITDEFAVEVLLEASSTGTQGNISRFNIISTDISGVSNVTNVVAFGGGSLPEDDTNFRSRILAIFSGANTGTELGYKNAIFSDPAALDSFVAGPGSVLMTRDGTQVSISEDGTRTITSEGTGGKVDVYVLGTRLQEVIDTYVYSDLSNTNNATNPSNNFVLGQIVGDAGKTLNQRRLSNLASGTLPSQPVNNIFEVSGSISGPNFIRASTDEFGRTTGNYRLKKDVGEFAGSPFGFDALEWVSNEISNFPEDRTKGIFNGQDTLTFTDISEISNVQQRVSVTNENSTVLRSDRSLIQLKHKPVINVTRVTNSTTGERYVVSDQNPDGSGATNTTGRIKIQGSSLPAVSDILQVDYTWIFSFDPQYDYDNRVTSNNIRVVQDSIDWGYSNNVRRESGVLFTSGSNLSVNTSNPISSVINVNTVTVESENVSISSGRDVVIVSQAVQNVISVIRDSDGVNLFNVGNNDGSFNGFTIFLPTGGLAEFGDSVTITYNAVDIFNLDGYEGSFNNNTINIVPSDFASAGTPVEINTIANINNLLPATQIANMPAIRNFNKFNTSTQTSIGNQPFTNVFDINGNIVQNLRQAPSNVSLTISGSISPGVITISGTTINRVADAIITVPFNGLTINLSTAIRNNLGLLSNQSIPSNVKISKVSRVEKVTTTSGNIVLSSDVNYDIIGYELADNSLVKSEAAMNTSLSNTQFKLPETENNTLNSPVVGESLRVTFHYTTSSDSENVSFSVAGTQITNKKFVYIESASVSSGFNSPSSSNATLTLSNFNQPSIGSRYRSFYSYEAPKQNERITIRYNTNRLIQDSTFNIENTRPITADVLVKEGTRILVDVIMNIVVTNEFINNSTIVQQNVVDSLTSSLNTSEFGTIIDQSDLITTVQSTVDGVDRARILFFNVTGSSGSTLSLTSQENQFFAANTVTVNIEER